METLQEDVHDRGTLGDIPIHVRKLKKKHKKLCSHPLTKEFCLGYKPNWLFQQCCRCDKVIGKWMDFAEWNRILDNH